MTQRDDDTTPTRTVEVPMVTQQDPSVTLPGVIASIARPLKVEIEATALEALRAQAASAHSLAREVEEAKRACQVFADALEAARVERDEARAEVHRLRAVLLSRAQ